jgi:hypothetical protein
MLKVFTPCSRAEGVKGKYVESFCSIGGRVKNTPWTAVRGVFDIPWVWLRTYRNVSV